MSVKISVGCEKSEDGFYRDAALNARVDSMQLSFPLSYDCAKALRAQLEELLSLHAERERCDTIDVDAMCEPALPALEKTITEVVERPLIPYDVATKPPVVLIGSSPDEIVPAIVCEYTIKKHCPEAIVLRGDKYDDRPTRGLVENGGLDWTNFSFQRFWAPQAAREHFGVGVPLPERVIYIDCDMILLSSIRELYEYPMPGHSLVARTSDPSVLLINMRVPWDVNEIMQWVSGADSRARYAVNMRTLGRLDEEQISALPEEWNHRDEYRAGTTKLLHFTNMNKQPWPNHRHADIPDHPLRELWFTALRETHECGMLDWEDIPVALQLAAFNGVPLRESTRERAAV